MKYVIATFSLFDNELTQELIEALSVDEAIRQSSKAMTLIGHCVGNSEADYKLEAFNSDGGFNILELPQ
jgi:hypothetical protein